MLDPVATLSALRRTAAAALLGAATVMSAASVVHAQNPVVVLINGEPVTEIDIDQRTKFLQVANSMKPRVEIIQELMDEKIKLHLPKRIGIADFSVESEVDNALYNMARRSNKTARQFTDELAKLGVLTTLKQRIRADITWTQLVRGKYIATLQLNDSEILKELETRKTDEKEGYDYTLRPILFIVPKNAPPNVIETRRREAEGLRNRFQNCEEGLPFARALREVVVREAAVKSSADLSPALRDILEKTEVGKLTPPENTLEGIVVYAVCSKKTSAKDNSPGKNEVRQEIYSKQFQASSQKFLKEVREQAYCAAPDGRVIKGCLATGLITK